MHRAQVVDPDMLSVAMGFLEIGKWGVKVDGRLNS